MDKQFFYSKPIINAALEATEAAAAANKGAYFVGEATIDNPWDQAHQLNNKFPEKGYVEPDLERQNPEAEIRHTYLESLEGASIDDDQYDPEWPFPKENGSPTKRFWHLEDNFSQLRKAWQSVDSNSNTIRIAHFDTGYDPNHHTCPPNIEVALQRNFVESNNSAIDVGSEGWFKQPYHGVGTISILGGNTINIPGYNHNDYIGIHHNIKILPIRISKSVILWKSKAFVDALEHIINLYDNPETRYHIVTMSMGGMPSKAWADVVNRAYDKGIFIVTAAGNNIGRATPSTLIYPARFGRVTAACGVTFDYSPYFKKFGLGHLNIMEGNFGPRKAMKKAIAAFTPNVAWAVKGGTNKVVSINGAGTSSATPQIAAAAALYYQKYFNELEAMPGWQRVETIRVAMYQSASKEINDDFDEAALYFGNGILQASDMLDVAPDTIQVVREEPVEVKWPFLKIITGANLLESAVEMYEMEILQLISKSIELQNLLDKEEKDFEGLTEEEQKKFYKIILNLTDTSNSLKTLIIEQGLAN